ncbi:MAG: ATP-dependent zinc metalloprotease FtsH [Bacteroidales bacterium]|nr:ATP-dependent zinc metalloprotease FtsH [Bacteroidales bacterium]
MTEEKQNNNNNDQNSQKTPNKKNKFNSYWIPALIGLAIFSMYFLNSGQKAIKTDWKTFKNEMLLKHEVERLVVVNDKMVEVYIDPAKLTSPKHDRVLERGISQFAKAGPHYYFNINSVEIFERRLEEAQAGFPEDEIIYPESEIRKDVFGEVIGWLLPIIILVAIWLFIFRRMSGGAGAGGGPSNIFNVGKSKAKIFDKESNVKVDFKDVAGLEEAKMEIKEIVDFLKKPKKYTELGGKIPKGALLVGPPGTGKTLLAKAVAGEAHVPFFSMSGSDFVEMFVGVGASRVRDLFKTAKEKAPCIIFIDEIDAIGRARGRNPNFGANDERENTLNQLLTEMDGFATNTGVIILAATNRADVLDRALLRAGRFDRQIHVELPDLNERKEIFKVHLRPIKLEKKFDLEFLAKQTPGFSGADIANVCNESALIAARKNKKEVQKQDFLDAIDRIIGGLERKNKIITYDEKKTIAYHEAGHATISWLLEYANPLVKVTIIPRGKALGAAWYLPEERQITTKEQLLDEMCSALGGRASEEIIFGKISTGALNDLEKITKQSYAMVTYFGLSEKVGNKSFYDSSGQNEYSFTKPYSEKTAELIDQEVSQIIEQQYQRAKKVLIENKKGLSQLAEFLLEKEVIFSEDLEKIFGKRKFKTREELSAELAQKTAPIKAKTSVKKSVSGKSTATAKPQKTGTSTKENDSSKNQGRKKSA